jgi:phage shock protein C
MVEKRLYRLRENAMIAGICAGLAEYFNIDPSLVRLATVILIFPGGLSIWAYIIAWIIIPQKPLVSSSVQESTAGANTGDAITNETTAEPLESEDKSRYIVGIILVGLGVLFLLNSFDVFVWFSFFKLWPLVLIIVGLFVLFKGVNRGAANEN